MWASTGVMRRRRMATLGGARQVMDLQISALCRMRPFPGLPRPRHRRIWFWADRRAPAYARVSGSGSGAARCFLDYIGSASQGIKHRGHIAWKEQLLLVPFMLIGIGLGLFLLRAHPPGRPQQSTGRIRHSLCGSISYCHYRPCVIPDCFATLCGMLGGLMGTLFGTGGPFYAIYLNLRNPDKSSFRATFAANFLIDGGIRLTAYAIMGLLTSRSYCISSPRCRLWALDCTWVGVFTSVFPDGLLRFISLLLLASGLMLLLK